MTFDINVTIRDTRCAAALASRIPITTGCRGEFRAVLHPDESWAGMDKTVVFRAGHIERSQYIGAGTECLVPPEVLASTASALEIGVYGTIGGDVVRTTTFARVGGVLQGARPTDDPTESPDLYAQLLAQLNATVRTVNGQAPDENGNVTVEGGGGGAGTPGGYYTPQVTQPDNNTMRVRYAASQPGMTDVPDVDVTLPQGQPGAAGKTAYEYAQDGGYTGTEEEFSTKLAQGIPAVDSTLTQIGQAADAAAVGDRFSALSEENAELKDDLTDLRTAKMERYTIKTVMDSVATPHTQYYLGNQTTVDIVLPDSADVGQIIMVCWYNGETAATLSITGTMLDFDFAPSANTRSEINALWDGTYWSVLGNEMAVPSEVTV